MRPTVWLHGAALHGGTWVPTPEGLCPDLPGHRGAPAAAEVSVRGYADAVLAQMPEHFRLVGHSLGAMVAIDIAARYPQRCSALVLVDPPLRLPLAWMPGQGSFLAPLVSRVPGPRGIGRMMALRVERPANRPLVRQAIAAMTRAGLRDAMLAALRFDGADLLPQLSMPTLALLGKRSVLTGRRTAAQLEQGLPQGIVEVWDTGHMIPFDAPEAFYGRVEAFFSGLGGS